MATDSLLDRSCAQLIHQLFTEGCIVSCQGHQGTYEIALDDTPAEFAAYIECQLVEHGRVLRGEHDGEFAAFPACWCLRGSRSDVRRAD